ncbi:MAG: HIT domain-containing protein [Methylococcaceae bacterium]|nr:HIT domain-containing protein [Methylococcaceae bacterium]MDZ4156678.1 HIT domain-containing protein [Methylococcales bacterium]MDP2394828.1 HIT domain-containing protein [Methylococcaceae bacterium]MDP3020249.1 HIT domain-containing protein [Methylococcaceae bacterium]MDP3390790.1 HIT domain-containing protein [Methylococcaceae bacterium]
MPFTLHTRLQQDCITVGRFDLCRLLMMNDSLYPWFILVPEKADISEIYQLNQAERSLLIEESSYLAEHLALLYKADKMNVAAIGNMVPQLHIHHIVRYRTDKAWPGPVWGKFDVVPLTEQQISKHLILVKDRLSTSLRQMD